MASNTDSKESVISIYDDVSLDHVQPFRMNTLAETELWKLAVAEASGLSEGQFYIHPFGFPAMPIPVSRTIDGSERVVTIPQNVSTVFWKHPIYWVDPELTKRLPEEKNSTMLWSTRMFYLLMALGLIDPDTQQWYPVPELLGVKLEKGSMATHIHGKESPLDDIVIGQDDMVIPYSEYVAAVAEAKEQLIEMAEDEWRRGRTLQSSIVKDSAKILKSRTKMISGAQAQINKTIKELEDRDSKGMQISDSVDRVYSLRNAVLDRAESMERLAYELMSISSLGTDRDMLGLSHFLKVVSDSVLKPKFDERRESTELLINSMFGSTYDKVENDVFNGLINELVDTLTESAQSLEMQFVNFHRVITEGKEPFGSKEAMDASHVTPETYLK